MRRRTNGRAATIDEVMDALVQEIARAYALISAVELMLQHLAYAIADYDGVDRLARLIEITKETIGIASSMSELLSLELLQRRRGA